ncbi:MAG: cytochrome c biogenesis heme-transporting ATPase CcmA [Betaproteobacteria bacterium]
MLTLTDVARAPGMLEVQNLAARRGYSTLFAGVSFRLAQGRVLTLTGPNGSGKTTLLRILAGLTAPWEGVVCWRDEVLAPFAPRLRQDALLAAHVPALKDELTAGENLTFQCALAGQSASAAEVRHALDAVALDAARALPAGVLSQGQRRRIGLARLMLVKRPLWLLDEPATALDAAGLALLGQMIGDHVDNGGIVVATTHQSLALPVDCTTALALA